MKRGDMTIAVPTDPKSPAAVRPAPPRTNRVGIASDPTVPPTPEELAQIEKTKADIRSANEETRRLTNVKPSPRPDRTAEGGTRICRVPRELRGVVAGIAGDFERAEVSGLRGRGRVGEGGW